MFKVKKTKIIAEDPDLYISFPDIIQSEVNSNTFFIVYRVGNNHHPTWSDLIVKRSRNNGKTWRTIQEIRLTLEFDQMVWNCPRFSYIGKNLYIICDAKNGTSERQAQFESFFLISKNEGKSWDIKKAPLPGMVPDKFIPFKDKIFCANHKIKSEKNDLIQLISWSRDKKLWYDTNIMAHSLTQQFCEASVVNMGDFLITYLRDNSGHCKPIYTTTSKNGIDWNIPKKLSIYGQRVTALKDRKNIVVGAYRNTARLNIEDNYITPNRSVSVFEHNLKTNKIKVSDIDWEYPSNQYHFGYTGMVKLNDNSYMVVYYIKQDSNNPFIKLAFVEKS